MSLRWGRLDLLHNPYRGRGLPARADFARGRVESDPASALALYARCPVASITPLLEPVGLASELDVGSVHLKDERKRMGLGSFKALGASHVIAREASARLTDLDHTGLEMSKILEDRVYVCASAGNHGLSVAAGARVFGARSVIYLSDAVPAEFEARLREKGAEVVRWGSTYEESMDAAARDADANDWTLLSDSSWPGYVDIPMRVMEGYLIMGAEARDQIQEQPTHVFLQAGVGGMAAAIASLVRATWGESPTICIVEPSAAPALMESIRAGQPVSAPGPVSTMGRLDCKEPSHIALSALSVDADWFLTVTDGEAAGTVDLLGRHGITTTPSGAAGVSAVHHLGSGRRSVGLSASSRVLAFITEGSEDR